MPTGLRAWRAPTMVRRAADPRVLGQELGRRQAVRQRILIPPYGGSNPPAPATHSGQLGDLQSPEETPGIPQVCDGHLHAETGKSPFSANSAGQLGFSLGSHFSNLRNFAGTRARSIARKGRRSANLNRPSIVGSRTSQTGNWGRKPRTASPAGHTGLVPNALMACMGMQGQASAIRFLEEHYPERKLQAWLCEIGQHKQAV